MDKIDTIRGLLNLKKGDWIDNKTLKLKIQIAYNKVDFGKTAKASDILFFYNGKKQQKRENGVQLNGYLIL